MCVVFETSLKFCNQFGKMSIEFNRSFGGGYKKWHKCVVLYILALSLSLRYFMGWRCLRERKGKILRCVSRIYRRNSEINISAYLL